MKLPKVLICGATLFFFTPALAQHAQCPPPWTEGWVNDREVAKAIYLAAGRAQHIPWFDKYPDVVVEDAGDHWLVYQTDNRPPPRPQPQSEQETVIVTTGGGQLQMNIDKCTGAISGAHLAR